MQVHSMAEKSRITPQFGKSTEGYENMGVAPGQTPWHPETPEQKMSDEKTFNADYFKE